MHKGPILSHLLLYSLLAPCSPSPAPQPALNPRHGRCEGVSYNYHRAVPTLEDCAYLCSCDRYGMFMMGNTS